MGRKKKLLVPKLVQVNVNTSKGEFYMIEYQLAQKLYHQGKIAMDLTNRGHYSDSDGIARHLAWKGVR